MNSLHLYGAEKVDQFAKTEFQHQITNSSSALEVFTDFRTHKPLLIDASTTALEAEMLMLKAHVRLKLVIDKDNAFQGIVSLADLSNQEVIKRVANGYDRNDLMVTDFMQPKSSLKAFDYNELEQAKVSDVVHSLEKNSHQHCLVIDREKNQVRGLISASDIARKLNIPINLNIKPSFLGVYQAVKLQAMPKVTSTS